MEFAKSEPGIRLAPTFDITEVECDEDLDVDEWDELSGEVETNLLQSHSGHSKKFNNVPSTAQFYNARPLHRLKEEFQDDSNESRDYNQNTFDCEDTSTTSSSTSSKTSKRPYSVCPHCDQSIPPEEFSSHLHQHVMNGTVNYARLKEIMLNRKSKYEPASFSVETEPSSNSNSNEGTVANPPDPDPHSEHSEYFCDTCSSVFTSFPEFDLHQRTHQAESAFKCQYCNKSFTKVDVFEKHERIHLGEGPHRCHLCPKTFNQRVHLRSHLRKHNGEKPYGCQYCPREYADRSSLTYHERTHTGERPYRCQYCQRGFSKSGALKGHIVTHFRGNQEDELSMNEEPGSSIPLPDNTKNILDNLFHACRYCSKVFSTLSTVRIHERSHSGERPYVCDLCKRTFSQLAHLNTHKKSAHPGATIAKSRSRGGAEPYGAVR